MKKIIICILAVMMIFSGTVSAEMDFALSADADKIISTEVQLKKGELVKIIVLKEDADINNITDDDIFYFGVVSSENETDSVVAEINMTNASAKERYTVYAVSATGEVSDVEIGGVKQIGFDTVENRTNCLAAVKTAIYNDNDESDVKLLLEGDAEFLGVNLKLYDVCDKDKVAKILVSDKERVSFGTSSDLQKMIDFIDESMLIDVLNGSNADKITLDYLFRVINGKGDYATLRETFAGIKDEYKANVLRDVKNKNYKVYGDFKQELINAIVINAFNYTDTNTDNLYKILSDYKDGTYPKLNLSNLNQLSYSDKMSAVQGLSNKKLGTIPELNAALSEELEGETIQNAPAGGGGGGGGGVGKEAIDTPSVQGIKPFSDVDNYKWVEEALYYLTHKNIISGYENGQFRPQNNITRAEFIKIVVSCFFEIENNAQNPFVDVADDAWYSSYVKTAYAKGLISGVSATQFAPDTPITRQDMAVVLYNAAYEIDFDMDIVKPAVIDADSIAEYAIDAVGALKGAGVINGYEDNSFRPSNYANRAETAQMIFNFLVKKGEYDNEK